MQGRARRPVAAAPRSPAGTLARTETLGQPAEQQAQRAPAALLGLDALVVAVDALPADLADGGKLAGRGGAAQEVAVETAGQDLGLVIEEDRRRLADQPV